MIKPRSDLHSRTTPQNSPLRASFGVGVFMSYIKKNDRDISRAHCTGKSAGTVVTKFWPRMCLWKQSGETSQHQILRGFNLRIGQRTDKHVETRNWIIIADLTTPKIPLQLPKIMYVYSFKVRHRSFNCNWILWVFCGCNWVNVMLTFKSSGPPSNQQSLVYILKR